WLLLTAAITAGQWWWALVMVLGGLLAGGYMFQVLAPALADADEPLVPRAPIARSRGIIVLVLALCSVLLGFLPLRPLGLLQIGRPNVSEASARCVVARRHRHWKAPR